MADPYFNPHTLYADFQNAYKSVMSRCDLVLNDCPQQSGVAFGLHVQETAPNIQLNRSILNGENVHSPFNHSRFKQVPVRVIYHQDSTLNGTAGNSYSGVGQSTSQSSFVVDSNLHHFGEISNQGHIDTVSHPMPQVAFDKPQENKMLQDKIDSVAHATGSESERTYFQDYYTKNKDTILAKQQDYRAKNKETLRAKRKNYYTKNKDTLRAKKKDYYTKNKDTIRAKQQDYRTKNKDTLRAKKKDYRAKNKDTLRAKKQDYYTKNKDTLRAKQQDYRAKNKDTIRAKQQDYRTKNKDTLRAKKKDYREKNKDTLRAKKQDYYTKNKDTIRTKQQDYRAKNKDTIRAKQQDYYTKNKNTILAKRKDYRAKNKDTLREVGESSQRSNRPLPDPLFSSVAKLKEYLQSRLKLSHPE